MSKPNLVRKEASIKRNLYRELASRALKLLVRLREPCFIFDCGCGRAYEVVYGFLPALRRLKHRIAPTFLLLDLSKEALAEALGDPRLHGNGEAEAYGVVCDVAHLPFNKRLANRSLGYYGSVIHEVAMRNLLEKALEEAKDHFRFMVGYDYIDPDPFNNVRFNLDDLSDRVRRRVLELAEALGVGVEGGCSLSLLLEAVYQLGFPGGQPLSHLHFIMKPAFTQSLMQSKGFKLVWKKSYDISPEVRLRLKALSLTKLSFKPPLMGRMAWIAVSLSHRKSKHSVKNM